MSKDDSVKAPEDHGTASTFATYLNVVCIIAGSGTLSLPQAVALGGWTSLSFFIFTALATTYTSHLLISCLYCKQGQRLEQFADIGEASFGKVGRYLAKLFHYSVSLSSPTVYIYLTGENVFASFKILYGREILTRELWSIIGAVIILVPFALAKTLREVALLGIFGTFSTAVVVGVVAIYGGLDVPAVVGITQPIVFDTLGSSLAIIAFAYGGTVCFPHVEASMRNPKAWTSVVGYGVATSTVFYFIVSITGYIYFGNTVEGNILKSLPQGVVAVVVYLLITLHVLVAAPIFLASFALEQENILNITVQHMGPQREFLIRVLFRASIVVLLTLAAVFVPNLTSLTGLAGAIANCMTIFIIPIICHFKLYGWRNRHFWEVPFAIAILIVGVFGLLFGTIDTIKNWGK
ncbi:hypothetical protein DSO57_1039282 [Entomophthora muscae]|uniref:Uncharacterized protein n=1 Tax=Entomophthora muscae TaxID=34485 RepID=A0ACC2S0B3_9FUNG|nr:hypothetical protein DSO57_1039282 [Entomophthora muscae]